MWEICKKSFLHSLGVGVYIVLVAEFMNHANGWFGKGDTVFTGIVVLLLFTLSALVVGGLILGKPLMMYLDGKKKDAVLFLTAEAGWLLLFFLIALVVMALAK